MVVGHSCGRPRFSISLLGFEAVKDITSMARTGGNETGIFTPC
jgi:hypothetical protein